MKSVWVLIIPVYLSLYTAQGAMAANPCNAINAVTSASGRLTLKSGQACATSASIVWNDYYNDGTQHLLKYGTTTSYGTTINLKPFTAKTDITTNISNLASSTQYYGQFYRVYEGETHTTTFTFKTSGGTGLGETLQRGSLWSASIRAGSAVFSLDIPEGSTIGIALYSLKGARITSRSVVAGKSIDFAKILPAGVYLCTVTTPSGTVSRTAMIGKERF